MRSEKNLCFPLTVLLSHDWHSVCALGLWLESESPPRGSWVRKYLLTRTTSVLILESLPYNESRVDSLIGWSDAVQVSHWLRT